MNNKILKIISLITFACFIGYLIIAMVLKQFSRDIFYIGGCLLFISLLFLILHLAMSRRKKRKEAELKKPQFKNLPAGYYKIKDNKSDIELGILSSESVDFLRRLLFEQEMDENDFYFPSEALDLFLEEEKPNEELRAFLIKAMKDRYVIELHWEPADTDNTSLTQNP